MLKSLKQLLRTPVKAVLFFLLMAAATALLVLGAGLWLNTQHKIDAAESTFTTIGTVTQKENAVQVSPPVSYTHLDVYKRQVGAGIK